MKKKLIIATTAAMLAFGGALVHADNVAVTIDGQYLSMDVPAQIMNERTMVPMRAIFEALGATVDWNGDNQQIHADAGEISILMQIDSPHMYVASDTRSDVITLDQPPVIVEGRTLVPARAISEALDANVGWDGANSTVNIESGIPLHSSHAYFYKGNAYYSLEQQPAIYVWDGNTNYRYAAGGVPQGIVIYNDYIFYYNKNSESICRMNLDGSNRQVLTQAQNGDFIIKNGAIYYQYYHANYSEDIDGDDDLVCRIYSVDINGGNNKMVAEINDVSKFFMIRDDHVSLCDWTASKNYIYYGVVGGSYSDWGCDFYRYSFSTGTNENINSIGYYLLDGCDKYGNVLLSDREGSKTYTVSEPSANAVSYSDFSGYGEQWFYYTLGSNVWRKQLTSDKREMLATGTYMGSDEETVMYKVNTYKDPKNYNYEIVSQQIYVMDLDGNNIRLVNEYSNGSAVQSNTTFDNSQSTNQQTTCAVCHGLGYYDCQICHGEGLVTCYTLAGTEIKTCTHCGGRKRISCTVCGGDGILHN